MAPRPRPRIDGRSLVDPALHSPLLMDMLHTELSRSVIEYVVDRVVDVVDYALCRPSTSARGRPPSRSAAAHAEFSLFAGTVVQRAGMHLPVLLGTLVYLDRARPHLQLSLEDWACERVFLGALICANKYLNDSTLKNVHWSLCTALFNKRDVGRIEREFLDVLDFELRVSEDDILAHYAAFAALKHARAHRHRAARHASARASAARRDAEGASSDGESLASADTGASSSPDSSLPTTPPTVPLDRDPAVVRRASSKHSPAPPHTPSIPSEPPSSKEGAAAAAQKLRREPSRRSSGFSILGRSIHVPHFHSGAS